MTPVAQFIENQGNYNEISNYSHFDCREKAKVRKDVIFNQWL